MDLCTSRVGLVKVGGEGGVSKVGIGDEYRKGGGEKYVL